MPCYACRIKAQNEAPGRLDVGLEFGPIRVLARCFVGCRLETFVMLRHSLPMHGMRNDSANVGLSDIEFQERVCSFEVYSCKP